VVAVAVAGDEEESQKIKRAWDEWSCNVPIEVLIDPHRSLVRPVLRYIESIESEDVLITVLIAQIRISTIPVTMPRSMDLARVHRELTE